MYIRRGNAYDFALAIEERKSKVAMSFSNSSGSCTYGGKQPSGGYDGGRSSHGGGSSHGCGARIFAIKPMCYCGQTTVLRTAKTPKNRGKQFWGCPKFKVRCGKNSFFVQFKFSGMKK